MEIRPGDRFIIQLDEVEIPIQAVSTKDGGETWHCCRTDRSLAESSLLLPATDLIKSRISGVRDASEADPSRSEECDEE